MDGPNNGGDTGPREEQASKSQLITTNHCVADGLLVGRCVEQIELWL